MWKRTKSREYALQILYRIDITKEDANQAMAFFWADIDEETGVKEYAVRLVTGIRDNISEIDRLIVGYTDNWTIERMAVIDRNIIRLSAFELLYVEEVPVKVSINEAVEIAKKYGDIDSSKFVNGILDKISKENSNDK